MTYRRATGPEFSQELEQRQKRACRKKMGQNIHFEPHCRRGWTLLQSHQTEIASRGRPDFEKSKKLKRFSQK